MSAARAFGRLRISRPGPSIYLDQIQERGDINEQQAAKLETVLERIAEEGIDPDSLTVCGQQASWNPFRFFISSAYAADGCVIRFAGGQAFSLSETEQQALRETQRLAAAEKIPELVTEVVDLRAVDNPTEDQKIALAQAEGRLVQQMAYYELCADEQYSLRNSGLVPTNGAFDSFFKTAEIYKAGGDGFAAKLTDGYEKYKNDYIALRKENPDLYHAMIVVLYKHDANAVDAAFLLNGISALRDAGQDPTDLIKRAANSAVASKYPDSMSVASSYTALGSTAPRDVERTLALAAAELTPSEKVLFVEVVIKQAWDYYEGPRKTSEFLAKITEAIAIVGGGAAGGVKLVTGGGQVLRAGSIAFANCIKNPVCRNEAVIAMAEASAGEALGGGTLITSTGAVVATSSLKYGDEVVEVVSK